MPKDKVHSRVALVLIVRFIFICSHQRDHVTKKPRYGEKTIPRVEAAIRSYKALEGGLDALFKDTDAGLGVVSALRLDIQRHRAQLNDTIQARRSQEQLEVERLAREMILAEERANRERLLVEQRKRDEERELARHAEEARVRRFEEEQAAIDAERRADRELLAMVLETDMDGWSEWFDTLKKSLAVIEEEMIK